MPAELILDFKDVAPDGAILQMRVWKVDTPIAPSGHDFKYSLYYGYSNRRIVAFDNERGKGDHCHLDGSERPYTFVDIERLIEDFIVEVDLRRGRG